MKSILNRIASILAFTIGSMAIVAGGKVLLGIDPGYYVINWLPVYNYTAGILTVFITAALIWTGHKYAWPAAIATISAHALVMLILQAAYGSVVASESTRAMIIRLIVWGIVLGLMFAQVMKSKSKASSKIPAASVRS